MKHVFFSALRKHGVKKGDRVVGYIPNCAEAIEAMAATAAIGAIWSSTSPDFGVSGVLDRFSQIQPKVRISSVLSVFSAFLASSISSHRYSPRFESHLYFFSAFLASTISSHRYSPRFESHLHSIFFGVSGFLNQISQIQLN